MIRKLAFIVVCVSAVDIYPQSAPPELPPIEMIRWEEDYSGLAGRTDELSGIDRLKWIPIGSNPEVGLTIGGSLREQFESYQNREFGLVDGDDDVYLMHRLLLHGDLQLGGGNRVFVELGNALIPGRAVDPSPVDENELHLHQAFADITLGQDQQQSLRIRAGRQEMPFGSGRLVSIRDGPNNRLSFDAVRLTLNHRESTYDAFVAAPVDLEPGVFDDEFNDDTLFWGLYATRPIDEQRKHWLDVYYFGIDRDKRTYGLATGQETRHSLGLRLFGEQNGFDYNLEAVYQFGDLGPSTIRAWTFASDVGYTFVEHPWKPRLGLRANVQSGADAGGGTTETFDPLFPNNSYFSEAAIIFPANLIDVNPRLTVNPSDRLKVEGMWDFLWRTSTDDAVYGPPGVPIIPGAASNSRFVGHSASLLIEYEISRHSSLTFAYTHLFAGDVISDAGGDDVDYAALWWVLKF